MRRSPKRISVVIPTQNRRELLREAIISVRAQTVRDVELVVIDQRSTDDTRAMLDATNVTWVDDPRSGAGNARNLGIEVTTSPHIVFLDSDDALAPRALEHLVSLFEEPSPHFAFGGVANAVSEHADIFPENIASVVAPLASSTMVARKSFDRFGLFDDDNFSFPRWVVKARLSGATEKCTSTPLAFRRIHPDNLSQQAGATTNLIRLARFHRDFVSSRGNHADD